MALLMALLQIAGDADRQVPLRCISHFPTPELLASSSSSCFFFSSARVSVCKPPQREFSPASVALAWNGAAPALRESALKASFLPAGWKPRAHLGCGADRRVFLSLRPAPPVAPTAAAPSFSFHSFPLSRSLFSRSYQKTSPEQREAELETGVPASQGVPHRGQSPPTCGPRRSLADATPPPRG